MIEALSYYLLIAATLGGILYLVALNERNRL